ncbi:MAG: glycosyltransferase, partial [Bacteroidales bacterium]|nr:glycosyltransferase [Bacteroidales bacterium]
MRVLQIINSLNTGGAEKLLLDSLPLYEKKNIRVDILILQKTETPFLEQLQTNFKGRIFFSTVKSLYNPRQI